MSLLRVVRLSEPSGPAIDVPRPRGPRGTYLPNARQHAGLVRAAEDTLTSSDLTNPRQPTPPTRPASANEFATRNLIHRAVILFSVSSSRSHTSSAHASGGSSGDKLDRERLEGRGRAAGLEADDAAVATEAPRAGVLAQVCRRANRSSTVQLA